MHLQAPIVYGPLQVDNNTPGCLRHNSGEDRMSDFEVSGMTNGSTSGTCTCNKEVDNGVHPLYHNCSCQWPGCEAMLNTVPLFLEHLRTHHGLDDRSTAQCRVQTQAVSYLEEQLKTERDRLSAMMTHLHSLPSKAAATDSSKNKYDSDDSAEQKKLSPRVQTFPTTSLSLHRLLASSSDQQQYPESPPSPPKQADTELSEDLTRKLTENELTRQLVSESELSKKLAENELTRKLTESELTRKLGSEVKLNFPSPLPNIHYNGNYENMMAKVLPTLQYNLPLTTPDNNLMECKLRTNSAPTPGTISANAALYQNPNVKPPFTYASLIREAIISSPNKRMSLNEVYNWFSHTFSFFRFNNSQWKNAVRHNLSLHKCFQRVEGPVGSGWTVNEDEFQLRRANRVNAIRAAGEEDMSTNNYILSLQEHMTKIQEQMLTDSHLASELSDEFLNSQRSPKQSELINDTPRYWTKVSGMMSGADMDDMAELMRGKELKMKEECLEQS